MSRRDHIAKRPATYEDVLAAPADVVAELIDGALSLQPRPRPTHARVSSILGIEIGGPFDIGRGGPGGWLILDGPELHLGPNVVMPDLAGWRRERMPALAGRTWIETVPDWCCEVLSPSTRTRDLIDKRAIYADVGVAYLWFVEPDARTPEAFRLTPDGWLLLGTVEADEAVALAPFEAAPFGLRTLWPPEPDGS